MVSAILAYSGFTANLEIRGVCELLGNLKMDASLMKNQGIIREF